MLTVIAEVALVFAIFVGSCEVVKMATFDLKFFLDNPSWEGFDKCRRVDLMTLADLGWKSRCLCYRCLSLLPL